MPIAETVRAALGTSPTLDQVVDALRVYASTLARLAEAGVHHRDLKPDNLFRHEGDWVVGDFGLVTWPGKQALTEPGQKLGPAHFVAPEMVDDPAGADPGPADVWSLAKVLWVLASGQNYPPPGQLRIADRATLLRNYTSHPRASGLEGILEQATRLAPSERPTMGTFAAELETWLTPAGPRRDPPSIDDLVAQVQAISAPASGRRGAARRMATRGRSHLRPAASRAQGPASAHATPRAGLRRRPVPHPPRAGRQDRPARRRPDLGRIADAQPTLAPPGQPDDRPRLGALQFLGRPPRRRHVLPDGRLPQTPRERLPEVFVLETRDVRVGTEHGRRAADELAQLLIDRFSAAAARYAELLAEAEARAQQTRQPPMESVGTNYLFRTRPEAGVIEIVRRSDGSVDGHGIAWPGAPLVEIRADGDRLYVRSSTHHGWMERNANEHWVLADSEPNDP